MIELCNHVLDPPQRYHYWSTERIMGHLMHEVAAAALQGDRLDLYDQAKGKVSGPMLPEIFQKLGCALAVTGEDHIKAR